MPKIIENLEFQLSEEARRQIQHSGYGAITIRSVAEGCGVGVGTVYNYFPSKEALVASFMLRDWAVCFARIQSSCEKAASGREGMEIIWQELRSFGESHRGLFGDSEAKVGFALSFGKYHRILRSQLAEPVSKFCGEDFPAEFVSEALLTWAFENRTFEELYGVLSPIFRKKEC